jgi:glutathione S-transferase
MIIVHHLENSRSQRILWLLEELSLPYEIKTYKRDKETLLAPPELKAVHPLGKSPVITDNGKVIAESAVIIDYLVNKYGKGTLKPSGEDDLLKYQYWLHYAEGSLMTPLLMTLVFQKVQDSPMPFFAKPIAKKIADSVRKAWINPQLKLHLEFMESEISKTGWFAGNSFSAADIMMSYPLEALQERGGLKQPHLSAFLKKVTERPAYKKAIERGGPFSVIPVSTAK